VEQLGAGGLRLARGPDRATANDALAAISDGKVGLDGVLDDLNRSAGAAFAPGRLTSWAFAWDRDDMRSARWWPQGITTSADAFGDERYAGREVVVTTSYSKKLAGLHKGSRITVVDITDPTRIRYRHVLLVSTALEGDQLTVHPVRAHAGGIVWSGPLLHVAATEHGVLTFRTQDIVRVTSRAPDRLGPTPEGAVAGYGHRYVLPLHCAYQPVTNDDVEPFRYSFLSLARTGGGASMLAGEYGHGSMSTRLTTCRFGPDHHLDDAGNGAVAHLLEPGGVPRMQGAVAARGNLYATSSRGRYRLGSLFVGQPGRLREVRDAVPVGPEDLSHWPSRGQLWSQAEYPRQRLVFTIDLDEVDKRR